MCPLVLPYLVDFVTGKTARETEISSIICFVESKRRKKPGILAGGPEKVLFVSKLYYPLWAVPVENQCVIVDGLGFSTFNIDYLAIPDNIPFMEFLKSESQDLQLFYMFLKAYSGAFESFLAEASIPLGGIIGDKDLLTTLTNYLLQKSEIEEARRETLPFVISKRHAEEVTKKFLGYAQLIEKDIEFLEQTANALKKKIEDLEQQTNEEIISAKQQFDVEFQSLKEEVEGKIKALLAERDQKISYLKEKLKREEEKFLEMKNKLERERLDLENEKKRCEKRLKKCEEEGSIEQLKRWELTALELKSQISKKKGLIKLISKIQGELTTQINDLIKKLEKEYEERVENEKRRILTFEASFKEKIGSKQKEIDNILSLADTILHQIEWLIDQKKIHISKSREITVPFEVDKTTLICLPFYVACFQVNEKSRYYIRSPLVMSATKGTLQKLQKVIMGGRLEVRMEELFKPRSAALERFLQNVDEKIKTDKNFEKIVFQLGNKANILKIRGFKKILSKGLDELEAKQILKPEEKKEILEFYTMVKV